MYAPAMVIMMAVMPDVPVMTHPVISMHPVRPWWQWWAVNVGPMGTVVPGTGWTGLGYS